MSLYNTALAYRAAGLCPVPILPGYKAPSWFMNGVPRNMSWTSYQTTLPTDDELRLWFDHPDPIGIGLIMGQASLGTEALDIDDAAYVEQFLEQVAWCGLAPLLARLVQERTPREGLHISYRCATIAGNLKLATVLDAAGYIGQPHCVIETRGEGGFLVIAPTPSGIHPTVPQRGYELLAGNWETVPTITPDERQLLLELAQSFHTVLAPHQTIGRSSSAMFRQRPSIGRPGDDLNAQADAAWWQALLEAQGWTLLFTNRRGIQHWQRPGKSGQTGCSATLGACGPYFYVFSTNAVPLESQKAYTPFGAYTFLVHGGHFPAAALALRAQGYGAQLAQVPEIRISTDLAGMTDALENAMLIVADDPLLYVHADRLCVLRRHHGVLHGIDRATGMPRIATIDEAYLLELASLSARWLKYDKRGKDWEPALPFQKAVQGLLARGQWQFPPLSGLITAPTLRPDGSYLDTPGYDTSTGLYLDANGIDFPTPPSRPTLDDARSAIGRVQEAIQHFPFEPQRQGFSSTIACLLTLLCRHMILGNVPLFAFTATESRTGKSLLASVLALIAFGRPPAHYPQVDDDEERKRLLSIAMEGDACVLIDNIAQPLGSPALDSILTAGTLGDRILGSSKIIKAPWTAVIMATGNNLSYKGDMAGRVVQIALDAKMERPEERQFAETDLLGWTHTHRALLVQAALTIIIAYRDAGEPDQGLTPFGGFERWSERIRSALVWAGEEDPCPGRAVLQHSADPMYERYAFLVECWQGCFGMPNAQSPPVKRTLRQVVQACTDPAIAQDRYQTAGATTPPQQHAVQAPWDALYHALDEFDPYANLGRPMNLKTVEHALRPYTGRVVNNLRFDRSPKPTMYGIQRWLVACP